MKTLCFGMLLCISLQFVQAQTSDLNQYLSISPDEGPVFVIKDDNGIKKQKLNSLNSRSNASDEKGSKKYIIEFRERPFFVQKKNKRGLSNGNHLARFTQLTQDVNRLYRNQKSKAAPKIRKQFHKVFFGAEADLTPELATALRKLDYVKRVSEVQTVEAVLDQSVSLVKANQVWSQFGNRGEGVTIGIIDTGIDYNHPALGNGFGSSFKVIGGYDFVNNDNDPMDDHGHGTHCAGIVAADGSDIQGMAPKANLVALKVLSAQGSGTSTNIIAAIEWAADPDQNGDDSDKLDILSLSLGGPGDPDDAMSSAVDNAVELGIVVCVAAGNSYDNFKISSPGTAREVITVGASNNNGDMAGFSSKGPNTNIFSIKPEVVAPGVDINSTVLSGGFASWSGTSMATPTIAGVAALLRSLHPDWTADQVKSAVMTTAADLGKEAMTQGAGQVNALKAARTSTFVHPAHVSFGMMAGTGTQLKYDTLTVFNSDTISKSYTTTTSGLTNGLTLSAAPASFTVAPGTSQQLLLTVSVNHNVLPIPDKPSGTYSGKVVLTSAADTLSLPWAVVKSGRVLLTFDSPYPYVWVYGAKGFNSSIAYINDGYAAETYMSPEEVDILTINSETMIFRENILLTGTDSIHISDSEAMHTLKLQAVDQNSLPLNNASQFYRIEFPTRSTGKSSIISIFVPHNEFKISSFSSRFQMITGHRRDDVTAAHTIHSIQHPTLDGLQQSITFTNAAADYLSQDIEIVSAADSVYKMGVGACFTDDQRYFFGIYYFTGNFTGSWKGKLYQSKTDPFADQGSVGLQAVPMDYPLTNQTPIITLPPFIPSGNGISASKTSPVRPTVYTSPSGGSMTFGTGVFYPYALGNNRISELTFYGKFNELLDFERGLATYKVLDESGTIVHAGSLSSFDAGKLLPGKNHLEVKLTPSRTTNTPGTGTYTAKFDLTNGDQTPLFLNSFQIRNGQGTPSDTLELGEYSTLRFSMNPGFSETHLFMKSHYAETWQELKNIKIAEETSGYSAFGYLYEAKLVTFDTLGLMDVKIAATTRTGGNQMEWKLERAFVLEDKMKPAITLAQGSSNISHTGSYDFGAVAIGGSSSAIPFTISNTGIDSLVLNGNPIVRLSSGNTSLFHVNTDSTTATLAPGETTNFNIIFTPDQPGIKTDTLWIQNNASTANPYYFILKGTSAGPEMEVRISQTVVPSGGIYNYPTLLVGYNYTTTFTIENKGSVDLNLTGTPKIQISGADASSFVISQQNLPAKLTAGASAMFTIQFKPVTPGIKSATITIDNNDSDENPYTFTLQGTAISGDINVKYAGADIVPTVTVVDMGSFMPGQSSATFTFTVENLGDGPLGFYTTPKVSASGANATDFKINFSSVPYQIFPGNTTSFTVTFTPSPGEGGLRTAEININSDDYDEKTFKIKVKGIVPSPEVAVAYYTTNLNHGSTRTFTSMHVGYSGTNFRFTLENKGGIDLQLNSPERMHLSGPDSLDFILDQSAVPAVLAPGTSAYFYISFKPTTYGTRKAKLVIANNDIDENPFILNLSATGLYPDIDVQQAGVSLPSGTGTYDFGIVAPGASSQEVTFQLANVGYTPLTFYSSPIVSKNSGNTNEFTIVQSSIPSTLQPGASAPFTITFSPVSAGQKSLVLRINSSDMDEYSYIITVKGNASVSGSSSARIKGISESDITLETEETSLSVKVFPNPSKHGFTIYLPANERAATVRLKIYNPLGMLLCNDELLTDSYYARGEDWAPGIYYIEAIGEIREVVKVVKE